MLRVYDQSISNWLNEWAIINGELVPHVMASPQRAFSTMREVLNAKRPEPEGGIDLIPLPFISFSRGSLQSDLRIWSRSKMRDMGFTDESKKYACQFTHPQSFKIPYTIEIWSKYKQTDAMLMDLVLRQFRSNYAYGMARHFDPWGEKVVPIHYDGLDDNSELEGGTDTEVTTRHTLNVTIDALLLFGTEEVPAVHTITVTYCEGTDEMALNNVVPLEIFTEEFHVLDGEYGG